MKTNLFFLALLLALAIAEVICWPSTDQRLPPDSKRQLCCTVEIVTARGVFSKTGAVR